MAELKDTNDSTSQGYFIILDVNGVLLERADFVHSSSTDADFSVNGRPTYKRPYLDEFLTFCKDSFHMVGIWTSMLRKNAIPTIHNIFESVHPHSIAALEAIVDKPLKVTKKDSSEPIISLLWTQNRCLKRTGSSVYDHSSHKPFKPVMFKDLALLWEGKSALSQDRIDIWRRVCVGPRGSSKILDPTDKLPPSPAYSTTFTDSIVSDQYYPTPCNTILIDDTAYKYAHTPYNGICIPEYHFSSENTPRDIELVVLEKYLKDLLGAKPKDVREWTKNVPYQEFSNTCRIELL
jgi:hypothetical protein